MVFIYIPPENSIFYSNQNTTNGIDILEEALFEVESLYDNCEILMAGDFNSRTSELNDFVTEDKPNYIPGLQYIINNDHDSKSFITQCKRSNKDKITNNFGRSLIQLCCAKDLYILNGRKHNDRDGEFTYMCANGASVIDYIISSYNIFRWISHFSVLSVDLSKHLPISCCLDIPVSGHVENGEEYCNEKQIRFKWNSNKAQLCKDLIVNPTSLAGLNDILELIDSNTNDAAKALVSHLQNICTEAGLLSCHNKSSERAINNQEWFDSECVSMKRKKCKLLNDFRATSNADILQEYVKTKQNFNKLCVTKQKQHKENKKTELCNIAKTGDSCKFWKLIKSVISKSNIPRSNISSEEWKTYFSDLLNPEIIDKDVNFSEFVDNFVQAHNTECDLCIDENFSYLDNDLALIADTPIDLQRRLNNLEKYCEKWNMTINMDKSNIVVFKNGGKLSKNEKWYFNNEPLKVVSYYKYLGIYFSNRLKWTYCCKTLRMQCEKALNMIKHCMCKLGTRDINLGFKLFDSMVAPILYYGAELWGTEKVKDIETVQNKFCKWLLGMGQKTNNHIARGECGRHELYINYVCKPIKYFLHLQCMDDNRLPKLCYRMMYKMNENGRLNWCSKVQRLLFSNGFGVVWESQSVGDAKLFYIYLNRDLQI
ncbi:unnamed protein product [Mytilus edulis]|uniref:Endonuclease/exonuclease/phosphatase domain-containing protein n=1 Tax=Mytilus edulis TaxID=6550 RepID=A0A8S3UK72_MYTED|nr:unnamed protein product [Mytilus edulis]